MHRTLLYSCLSILFLAFVVSCTGGGNVVSPVTEPDMILGTSSNTGQNQTHLLWGLWQFIADPEAGTLDIVQLRSGDMHLNALVFLEPPPLVNLTLESLEFNGNIIEADIGLRHPFLGLDEFTGFDVCGILITNGSITGFDDPDLRMAGDGDTRLLNPDGYSRWWNPAEFPQDGTMFGYKDGLLGTPNNIASYNSTLNAYKYFCDDLDPDDSLSDVTLGNRGMFSAGQKNIRHYTIDMGAGLIFNYAVDACWAFPQGDFPWTAPDDFAPEANRAEAWRISVGELENTLWNDGTESGGDLSLAVDVYDWFNAELNTVRIESPGNFPVIESTTIIDGGLGYSTYQIDVTDATPGEGSIDLLISVESETVGYGDLLPGKPVTVYFMHTSTVAAEAPTPSFGWARTWGGSATDQGYSVSVDASNNAYVTGRFEGTVDFDPGPDDDWHTSIGLVDAFLSKFDSSGAFLWAKTWGGSAPVTVSYSVSVDISGNVCVTGSFNGTVDFNPGSGVDKYTTNGGDDIFLSKFDSSGAFLWAKTWGGTGAEWGYAVATDASGNVYVTGFFMVIVDFDPDPVGEDWHTSNGIYDAFLSKFLPDGSW